jgi:hypothetical protein
LVYANEHRPWQLYQTVFQQLLEKCQQLVASAPLLFSTMLVTP